MRDQNMCQTCLSIDRRLVNINTPKIHTVLKEINCDELANKSICWECQSIIMKFFTFKIQAQKAQFAFAGKVQDKKSLSKLLHVMKCNHDYEFTYNDQSTNTSTIIDEESELHEIKQEIYIQESEEFPPIDDSSDDDKKLQASIVIKDAKNKTKKEQKGKILELDFVELQEKYRTVLLTEEEMLRSREDKRCRPSYKAITYKCDMCVLGFLKKDYYDVHLKKKHDEIIGDHICNICSTRFQSMLSMEKHKKIHYVHYACNLCNYKTSLEKAALNHCRDKHEYDRIDKIHCKQCTAICRTPAELTEHMRSEHTLYCNECGEKFKGRPTLRSHLARIHATKREFVCDVCTRSFLKKSRLESHMARHSGALALRLAYCSLCKIQYKNINVYRGHLQNNKNHVVDRYSCTECNKTFSSKAYWNKHYNFYHLNKSQYKCEACNKAFISKWKLKNHKQLYHGLSRSRNHDCNVCAKKFYTLATLRSHQLIHSERRQFMCEECGGTFKQRASLYNHVRLVHNGGKFKKKPDLKPESKL